MPSLDARAIEIAGDGTYELRFGLARPPGRPNYFALGPGSAMLLVREVFSDWAGERPGEIRIHRADTLGSAPPPVTPEKMAKRYDVAGRMLLSRLRTFLAFPEW